MSNIPLRERKYAKTKSDLMWAVISRLASQSLADIAVKDVCHDVQVSGTTFFNYFASKDEVIIYFVQLWSVDANWSMQQSLQAGGSHLDAIRVLFNCTAAAEVKSPGVMGEVVAYHALNRTKVIYTPLTRAEYALHFPDIPDPEQVESKSVEVLLLEQLTAAQQNHELPPELDLHTFGLTLLGIFFMTPVFIGMRTENNLQQAYTKQLNQLFSI